MHKRPHQMTMLELTRHEDEDVRTRAFALLNRLETLFMHEHGQLSSIPPRTLRDVEVPIPKNLS